MTEKHENNQLANREYKNSVFTLLFSQHPLELYSAITGKTFAPDTKITDTTLTDVLYRGRLNDLSFEINDTLVVLIEHQSTLNENLPLRLLEYYTQILRRHTANNRAIYGTKKINIPRPEFIVLYNGTEEMPGGDRQTLKLSDMFADAGQRIENPMGGLELTVEMFNINKGRNPEIAARSPALDGYETFIQMVRENENTGLNREDAVRKAVFDCIEQNILKEFLETYKWEIVNMLVAEWDFDVEKEVAREEGMEKGREKGREEGREESMEKVIELIEKGYSTEEIKKILQAQA